MQAQGGAPNDKTNGIMEENRIREETMYRLRGAMGLPYMDKLRGDDPLARATAQTQLQGRLRERDFSRCERNGMIPSRFAN